MKPIKVIVDVTARYNCPFRIKPEVSGLNKIKCTKAAMDCPNEAHPFPDNCPIVKNKYTREDFYEEALSNSNLGITYQFHLRNGLTEHNYYDLFKHLVREKVKFVNIETYSSYRRGGQFGVRFIVEYKDGHFSTIDFDVPYKATNSTIENIIVANNLVQELESKIREKIGELK